MSLRKKMAHGALWSFVEKGSVQLTSFVLFTVIVRIVGPAEYGLVALCYVYLGFGTTIFGSLPDGVTSLKIEDDRRLSTFFWTVLGGGLTLGALGYLMAAPLGILLHQDRFAELFQWFCCLPILVGLASVPNAILLSKMRFRLAAIRSLVGTTAGGAIGIILALKGFGAMALFAQQATNYVCANLVLWIGCQWRPKLQFDRSALVEMIAPGINYAGVNLVSYAQDQLPRFFIGYFLGTTAVGYYSFANRLADTMREVIFAPISIVMFPALASIKGKLSEQKRIISQLVFLLGMLIVPITIGAIFTAPTYVPLIFGDAWNPAISTVQLYLLSLFASPMITVVQSVFRAQNSTGEFLKIQVCLVGVILFGSFLISPLGLPPLTAFLAASAIVSLPLYTLTLRRKLNVDLCGDYKALLPSLLAALIMVCAIETFDLYIGRSQNAWSRFAFSVALGAIVYATVATLLYRERAKHLLGIVRLRLQQRT
ncbi:oligosaccharide flippase family protein [Bradyrhizobium vignae]|uniref:Oligosaccharide flippase family protein n=1 Tax=Bradyrhizobium vignae TaxID=1549949 RepID=A0ABS3ZSE8_9BRAD|nr:oligosaccharide flippase family protein [Bradyrhizobium vignae]MBP0110354.1 oligosaccharide flippase family protein [Bradyrhizobium vignae]